MFSFKYRHAESDPWETPASFAACLRVSIGFPNIGEPDFLFLLFLSPPDADRFASAFRLITSASVSASLHLLASRPAAPIGDMLVAPVRA